MTNGRGKSDSAIVAERPTNKAGRLAAEPEERRARRPRGTRCSKTRAGHRTGKACPRRWTAYGKWQVRGRRRSSPRSCITLVRNTWKQHSVSSRRMQRPEWTVLTWRGYEEDLNRKIVDLHSRLHKGAPRLHPWTSEDVRELESAARNKMPAEKSQT
jgi:RNA-directed DNA polymerase